MTSLTLASPEQGRQPDPRVSAVLREEVVRTLAAFRTTDARDAEQLLPLYAEQLSALVDVQELRMVFSIARQRATTYAPTPGEVREVLLDVRRRRSRAPLGITPLPPAPRFEEAERWLEANPWAHALVESELAHLTRDWPPELAAERDRFLPLARVLAFHRLADGDAAPAGCAPTLPGNVDGCRTSSPVSSTQELSR